MKKYYIKYCGTSVFDKIRQLKGGAQPEEPTICYAGSAGGDYGSSWCQPFNIDHPLVFDWYGTRVASIAKMMARRIFADSLLFGLYIGSILNYEIIEREIEPEGHFDGEYYLKRFYDLDVFDKVPQEFEIREGDCGDRQIPRDRVVINNLDQEPLLRLIAWAKKNLKPKFKVEPSQLSKIQEGVAKELEKITKRAAKRKRPYDKYFPKF